MSNIQRKQVETKEGPLNIATVQYPINENQVLIVIGVPAFYEEEKLQLGDGHGGLRAKWQLLGRLASVGFPIQNIAINSLVRDGWDFEADPNPICAIGTFLNPQAPISQVTFPPPLHPDLEVPGSPGLMTEMGELIRQAKRNRN